MKVSIITVVRNAVGKIEPTIKSVLQQDYNNLEYIVIDGESSDGTLGVINRYRDRIAVVVSEPDQGIYDALNKGILQATGDWIGIMNAGDVFASADVLTRVFGCYTNYRDVDVIYGDAIGVDGATEFYSKGTDEVADLLRGPAYRHGASFVRGDVHKHYLFDMEKTSQLDFALDYEQIYRMYKKGLVFRKLPIPIVRYELRGASTVSPFKITYCNYLITHEMKCGMLMKLLLLWLTLWRGAIAMAKRYFMRLEKCQ